MGQPRAKPTEGTASICASSRRSERNPLGEGSETGSACSGTAPQPSLKATRLVGKGGKATQGVCRECPRLCLWLCRWILVFNNNHLHRVQPSSALHLENRFTAVQMGWFVFGEGQKCQGVALGREEKKNQIWRVSVTRQRQYLCCHNHISPMENVASSGGLSSHLRRKKWELYWTRN